MKSRNIVILLLSTLLIILLVFLFLDSLVETYPARYNRSKLVLITVFDKIEAEAQKHGGEIPASKFMTELLASATNMPKNYEINYSILGKNIGSNEEQWLIREKDFKYADSFHIKRLVLLCNGTITEERIFSIKWPERYKILLRNLIG